MSNFIQNLFGKNRPEPLAELEKLRARENETRQQFAQIEARVQALENAAVAAREAYATNLSVETFAAFVDASVLARESRQLFSANASVLAAKIEAVVESPETRAVLVKAFRAAGKSIGDLIDRHEKEDRERCAEAGIEFTSSPTGSELRRKLGRVGDALTHLANESQPCWRHESVLRSL